MQNYGDKYIGISRDSNTQLSLALAHPIRSNGSWGITNGMFSAADFVPIAGCILYCLRLVDGREVEFWVPHLVQVPHHFQPGMDYRKEYCTVNSDLPNNEYVDNSYYGEQEVKRVL